MTKSATQRDLVAWQATTNPATLKDLIAWQALNLKTDDESVGQFLKRRLTSRGTSLTDGSSNDPIATAAASDPPGGDPHALIFDEMGSALVFDERFRALFFEGVRRGIVATDVADALAEANRQRDSAGAGKALVQAALDGRLTLFDENRFALIRAAVRKDAESLSS
ncbi:hypothetical protein [Brevundimonas sp.]|uniref:hypothetical protein n=1 Tax=Brevundimonas sp. TaxID=1871086 RepID=UPI0027314E46|nr:hypothetical protein [Brevundimonas sp.]MDP1912094.1 hypothetical protein [Brevundimonas sp.]